MNPFAKRLVWIVGLLPLIILNSAEACTRTRTVDAYVARYWLHQNLGNNQWLTVTRTLKVSLKGTPWEVSATGHFDGALPCRGARLKASRNAVNALLDILLNQNNQKGSASNSAFDNHINNAIQNHIGIGKGEKFQVEQGHLRSYTGLSNPDYMNSPNFRMDYVGNGRTYLYWTGDNELPPNW